MKKIVLSALGLFLSLSSQGSTSCLEKADQIQREVMMSVFKESLSKTIDESVAVLYNRPAFEEKIVSIIHPDEQEIYTTLFNRKQVALSERGIKNKSAYYNFDYPLVLPKKCLLNGRFDYDLIPMLQPHGADFDPKNSLTCSTINVDLIDYKIKVISTKNGKRITRNFSIVATDITSREEPSVKSGAFFSLINNNLPVVDYTLPKEDPFGNPVRYPKNMCYASLHFQFVFDIYNIVNEENGKVVGVVNKMSRGVNANQYGLYIFSFKTSENIEVLLQRAKEELGDIL